MAAYLLNMGPMPPPTQQEIAVATMNHLLDNPSSPGPANNEARHGLEDKNNAVHELPNLQPLSQETQHPSKLIFDICVRD